MNKHALPIAETFDSIQGEGMFCGMPSLFIRVSGCNLRCWWCDTKFTSWAPEMGNIVPIHKLEDIIAKSPSRHVVLTGGEPMLYPEQMAQLIAKAHFHGKLVTIETNGTLFDPIVCPDLWSVSPKLESSTPDVNYQAERERHRVVLNQASVLKKFNNSFPEAYSRVQFKFVVSNESDILEVQQLVKQHGIQPGKVWLMPEGTSAAQMLEKGPAVAASCLYLGYNFTTRLHVLLWGHKRGV